MLIRTGDNVQVITGADRGTTSRVIQVDRVTGKALVENVNRVYKHVRRSQKHPQGGRLSKRDADIALQLGVRVRIVWTGARLGARFTDSGAKERFCKKCGASAGEVAPAKKSRIQA